MRRGRLAAMALFVLLTLFANGRETAAASKKLPDALPWKPIGRYAYEPITESSGVIASRRHEGVYWTLNDSGNPPVLYATTQKGDLIREFSVEGAANFDWEDLTTDDRGRLWIGEIGNNSRLRQDLCLYLVPEPDPKKDTKAKAVARYPYRYPKENVDAEGLFLRGGIPYIVSKEANRAVVYRFPAVPTEERVTLARVAELEGARVVTGAALTDDGTRLVVCTYDAFWVYRVSKEGKFTLAWHLTNEFSPEAVCFDGYDLILTSEDRNIYRVPASWYEREHSLPPKEAVPSKQPPKEN